jgi:peptidoglycan/xylan/chitin deacetylase (PgdA/CDA1 family)
MPEDRNVSVLVKPRIATRIPVLLYHSVSDAPADSIAAYTVSPAVFDRHLDLITGHHQALTVSQLAECLAGREQLPEDPVVITFDDGFLDNLEVAAPRLAARKLTATVYVTTGYIGLSGMLEWEQLRDLEAMGIELGAHSHSHTPLDELGLADAADEIRLSQGMLEDRLQHAIPSFAYPHGYSTQAIRSSVRSAGFRSACGVRNAFSHPGDDPWCIARLTVHADTDVQQIERWLSGEGAPLAAPGEAFPTRAWRAVRRIRGESRRGSGHR